MPASYNIIICVVIVTLYLFIAKINLKTNRRQRQFLLPIIALAYCACLMYARADILEYMTGYTGSKELIAEVISKEALTSLVTAIVNIAILFGFVIVKACTIKLLEKAWDSDLLTGATSGWFYEDLKLGKPEENKEESEEKEPPVPKKETKKERKKRLAEEKKKQEEKKKKKEEEIRWVLKKQFEQFKVYYRGFYYTLLAVTTVIFFISLKYPEIPAFQAIFYPIFGVIILGEVVFFLSGPDRPKETAKPIEKKPQTPEPEYDFLREILKELFEERDLHDVFTPGQPCNFETDESMALLNPDSIIHEQKLAAVYFSKLAEAGENLISSYVQSSIQLIQGRSILINNPFYKDLTIYLIFPILRHLMNYHKCLIIAGRESTADDIKSWLDNGLLAATGTQSLWNVDILSRAATKADIGILQFTDIYNLDLLKDNTEFLNQVSFILLIEPSHILATAQMGLSLLVTQCESPDKNIIYCACDRNCDGLVDALSHTLKTNLTEVTATQTGLVNCSEMYWNADGEYLHHKIFKGISRYLGVGTEIAAIAAKNLHSIKTDFKPASWISCNKFPIIDMKWIAGQYYAQICQYAEMPATQESFNHNILLVESNLWKNQRDNTHFLIVEDEFQNLFEMKRVYSTRALTQLFINIISENYFLRDYMVNNVQIFETDPKAIPTFVPDFARTERNVILKLIMMMAHGPVSEDVIRREFLLCGMDIDDTSKSTNDILQSLIARHCHIQDSTLTVQFSTEIQKDCLTTKTVKSFKIDEINAISDYARSLKPAYFLAEDELGEKHYISSRLYGHVFQCFLPGQFTTFEGKYYEVRNITPHNGVVLRRAADHIHNRVYYRQLRTIHLDSWQSDDSMASSRTISGIEIANAYANFAVHTSGYIETTQNDDLKHAHTVLLNGIPDRSYINKSMLRFRLPGASPKVIYTICLLLNEIFKTTYPDSWQYIYAVTSTKSLTPDASKNAMYAFEGPCEDDVFYILEDSEIDLGLIVSVDRNIKRYFEMICDVLSWHLEKMLEIPAPKEEKDDKEKVESEPVNDEPEEKSFFQRIKDFFKNLFSSKQEPEHHPAQSVDLTPPPQASIFMDDDCDDLPPELVETEYQKHCFLKFGDDHFDDAMDFEGTVNYLSQYGYGINPLQQARIHSSDIEEYAASYNPQKEGAHFCDFCGTEMTEIQTLPDGREQCPDCAHNVLRTKLEYRMLFSYVRRNMERLFHIQIDVPIELKQTTARDIAAHFGEKFVPTPSFDARTVGFAKRDENGFAIYFEDRCPKLSAISTLAHELTHIWQFSHWDMEQVNAKTQNAQLELLEGMAMWVEIQYLYATGEYKYAARMDITTQNRKDAYGRGFKRFCAKYPISKTSNIPNTPFNHFPPL